MKNSLYDNGVGSYLDQMWVNNLLRTIHNGLCQITSVTRNAVVENSNGNNEGGFKHTKHDLTYLMVCKDQSTCVHHQYMQSRMHCAKTVDQLRDLQDQVDKRNNRKMKKLLNLGEGAVDEDEVLDKTNVKWLKKPDTLMELLNLNKLEKVMESQGIYDLDKQFSTLQEYVTNNSAQKYVKKQTFKKWIDPVTRGARKMKKHDAWSVIRGYVKDHSSKDDDNDERNSNNDQDLADKVVSSSVPALPSFRLEGDGYVEITDASISKGGGWGAG